MVWCLVNHRNIITSTFCLTAVVGEDVNWIELAQVCNIDCIVEVPGSIPVRSTDSTVWILRRFISHSKPLWG
jgi:hypothetical protein